MRILLLLLATTTLSACGGSDGTGVASAGSSGGTTATTPTANDPYAQFVTPTVLKSYVGVGGDQRFTYSTDSRGAIVGQQGQTYAGDLVSARDSKISITYDPTAATFLLTVKDAVTGAATDVKFQDPASRIDFTAKAPQNEPQWGTPNLNDATIKYYQAGDGDPLSPYLFSGSGYLNAGTNATPPSTGAGGTAAYQSTSFFYQKPGSTTQYVTIAGYLRNSAIFAPFSTSTGSTFDNIDWKLERGAFAFGVPTLNSAVPVTGTATYNGLMLGTMVYNTLPAFGGGNPTYFQWISGTSSTVVDFKNSNVDVTLTGIVSAPQVDTYTVATATAANPNPQPIVAIAAGSTFSATTVGFAPAKIDLTNTGGFAGNFGSATFTDPNTKAVTAVSIINTAGITGGFYGPGGATNKVEVGGGFRIVGGVPNQRVDILGAFTGCVNYPTCK